MISLRGQTVVPVVADAIRAARGALGKTTLTKALLRARAADKRHANLNDKDLVPERTGW